MLTIKEVRTRKDRLEYVTFQNELYRGVENYVPTMVMDEMANINPKKNPAFSYCDMRFFLAQRDGKTVGRIGAIISYKANDIWDTKKIRITRFDFIEDYEVFCLLIKQVEDWGREKGLNEMIGPIGFCDLDKEGMLVDGFDRIGMFITYYNHPYYVEFMERYGFRKEADWTEHVIKLQYKDEDKISRVANKLMERRGYKVLQFKNKKELKPYIPKIFDLLNREYKDLYGMVPLTQEQIDYYAGQFLTLINLRYVSFITDSEGEIIACGILAPSLVEPMKKSNGRLFPFGWIGLLKALNKPKVLDMYLVAVKKELQKTGVPAILINDIYNRAKADNILYAETGPELETNFAVQSMWGVFESEMNVRRRRCWIKEI